MKKIENQEIVEQYIKSGTILYETTLDGNYKKGNKEYFKLLKLYKFLEKNIDIAKQTLPVLLNHKNVKVRTIAASHCLTLKICEKEAETVLIDIANDEKNGIFDFNAEMTLKVWKEGNLKIH